MRSFDTARRGPGLRAPAAPPSVSSSDHTSAPEHLSPESSESVRNTEGPQLALEVLTELSDEQHEAMEAAAQIIGYFYLNVSESAPKSWSSASSFMDTLRVHICTRTLPHPAPARDCSRV